jgi:hypothetical protein
MYINFELGHFTTSRRLVKNSHDLWWWRQSLILIQLLLTWDGIIWHWITGVILRSNLWNCSYAYTYDRHLQTFQAGVNYVTDDLMAMTKRTSDSQFYGERNSTFFGVFYNVPYTNYILELMQN